MISQPYRSALPPVRTSSRRVFQQVVRHVKNCRLDVASQSARCPMGHFVLSIRTKRSPLGTRRAPISSPTTPFKSSSLMQAADCSSPASVVSAIYHKSKSATGPRASGRALAFSCAAPEGVPLFLDRALSAATTCHPKPDDSVLPMPMWSTLGCYPSSGLSGQVKYRLPGRSNAPEPTQPTDDQTPRRSLPSSTAMPPRSHHLILRL